MTEKAEIMRVLTSSPGDLVRSYFKRREAVAHVSILDIPTCRRCGAQMSRPCITRCV